jgi:putative nucleotidyltransferase with HDIG domain
MKILVVDDNRDNRDLLETLLSSGGYEVFSAVNGADALEKIRSRHADLIISDILMPVMDGFQFCREVKGDSELKNIPFIFHSAAYTSKKDEELANKLGVDRFIPKPIDPFAFLNIIQDLVETIEKGQYKHLEPELGEKEEDLRLYSERLVEKLEKKMASLEMEIDERKRAEEALKKSHHRLRQALEGTITAIAKAVEARDLYIAGHQQRVAQLSCAIAEEMGLNAEQIEGIHMGAMIHDIGKIHLPAEILGKPAKLLDTEYALIKSHPEVGYEILKDIEFPWPVAAIVHQHHEHLDGSGYPQGLVGDDILLEARIVCVADVVEAIAGHRPYRPALGTNKAFAEIEKNKSVFYDQEVVNACLNLFQKKNFAFVDSQIS